MEKSINKLTISVKIGHEHISRDYIREKMTHEKLSDVLQDMIDTVEELDQF